MHNVTNVEFQPKPTGPRNLHEHQHDIDSNQIAEKDMQHNDKRVTSLASVALLRPTKAVQKQDTSDKNIDVEEDLNRRFGRGYD